MLKTTTAFISLALVLSFLLSPLTVAAQTSSDWASVRSLPGDTKVSVRLKSGKTLEGKLASVTENGLTIANKKQGEVKREDVQRIHQLIRKSATSSTLIGMGIGAGAGAGLGAIADASDDSGFEKVDHVATAGLAVVGAVVGAVSGYFIGRKAKKSLVYESR